jgi:hypothetical protein
MNCKRVAVCCVALLAAGCGPGSFSGSVGGEKLRVRDAIFMVRDGVPTGAVLLSGEERACERTLARESSSEAEFLMWLRREGEPGLETGLYLVQSDRDARIGRTPPGRLHAGVWFASATTRSPGESGEIEVDEASADHLAGSFDLTFLTGDHVTGSFNAEACPL